MKSSLLNSLFDEEERRPLTVSELNEQVKGELERGFASVWIEGEISNFRGGKFRALVFYAARRRFAA